MVAASQRAKLHYGWDTAHGITKHSVFDPGKPIIGFAKQLFIGIIDEPADGIFARCTTKVLGTKESVKFVQIRHVMSKSESKSP